MKKTLTIAALLFSLTSFGQTRVTEANQRTYAGAEPLKHTTERMKVGSTYILYGKEVKQQMAIGNNNVGIYQNKQDMKKKSRLNKSVQKNQNKGFNYGVKIFGNPVHDSYRSLLKETFLIGVKGISFYENSKEVTLDWETLKKPRPTKGEANLLKQNRNVFIGTKPLYSNNGIVIATGYDPLQNFPVNYLPKYLSNGSINTVISNKNNQQ